jgi:drug/metabolite transporter (DMT)-like permease
MFVHSAGLVAFLAIIWPADKTRPLIAGTGPESWFWIHVAQAVVLGTGGICLFFALARTTQSDRAPGRTAFSAGSCSSNSAP